MLERWRAAHQAQLGRLRADAPWLLGLILVAAAYYGIYFRCGFNLSDEGSVALLSQRILQGERPLADLMLGYNVLWFYPIVGLFWLCGVSVLAMKIYFFALATLSSLLGFASIRKISGHRLYAFIVGLILIAIPGTSYRVYLPLLVIVNSYCLLRLIWSQGWTWLVIGGLLLGITFLLRIDLGIFFSIIWLGTTLLRSFVPRDSAAKSPHPLLAALLMASIAIAVHLPFYLYAEKQGFGPNFLQQYTDSYGVIRSGLARGFPKSAPANPPRPILAVNASADSPPSDSVAALPKSAKPAADGSKTLGRKPVEQIWKAKKWRTRIHAFVTYAPIVSAGMALILTLIIGARQIRRREPEAARRCLSTLMIVGAALTLFPQFFGFRPDMSHLAEFMPGFVVAAAGSVFYFSEEIRRQSGLRLLQLGSGVACLFLVLHTGIWCLFAFFQSGAGTISMRIGRNVPFKAANGVDVLLSAEDYQGYSKIRDLVAAHSKPGEYVVCYPYSPGINVLCDRPTYEWSLYVDNAVRAKDFDAKTIAKIEARKPAVIVLDDWAINQTEESRFSVWARGTQAYVASNYRLEGTHLGHQIYVRR